LRDKGPEEWIILKWILKEYALRMGLLEMWTVAGFFKHDNKYWASVKCGGRGIS
jgi:hypothetical protein